jgi:hypothetical protein
MFIVQLLCFLCWGSMFHWCCWCFLRESFWRLFDANFHFIVWFGWVRGWFVVALEALDIGIRYCNWRFDEALFSRNHERKQVQAPSPIPKQTMQCHRPSRWRWRWCGGYSDRSGYTRPRLSAIQEESIGSYGLGGFVGGIFKDRLFRIEMEWLICVTIMV